MFDGFKSIPPHPLSLKPFKKRWQTILYTDYSSEEVGFALTEENPENMSEIKLIFWWSSSISENNNDCKPYMGKLGNHNGFGVVPLLAQRMLLLHHPHRLISDG